jgi:hypothetical protein
MLWLGSHFGGRPDLDPLVQIPADLHGQELPDQVIGHSSPYSLTFSLVFVEKFDFGGHFRRKLPLPRCRVPRLLRAMPALIL